jgi:type I restriction enzyme S subunit
MNNGWQGRAFEDCIEHVTYTQKVQRKDFLTDGAYPIVSQEEDFINGYWDNEADLFKISTPVIVFGDHTKVLKYVDFDFVLGADGVKVLQPRKFLLPKFIYYQLQTADLDSLGYARHYKLLRELEFVYPSLPEQRRIVGILDEAFEGIATAKANADRNLQNARALFESHLQSVFTQSGNGWLKRTLGDLCETTQGVQIPKNLHFNSPAQNRRRYLYISDFDHDENLKYVEDVYPQKRVTENDLIVVNTGATAGKIYRGIDGVLSNNLFKVTLKPEVIDGDFLYYFVTSSLFKDHQKKIVKGTANPHMGHENFKSTPISIPSLKMQLDTVAELDALSAETQRLESTYKRKLEALDELKKSLLHQAFTGKL